MLVAQLLDYKLLHGFLDLLNVIFDFLALVLDVFITEHLELALFLGYFFLPFLSFAVDPGAFLYFKSVG